MGNAEHDRKRAATGFAAQREIWPPNTCLGFAATASCAGLGPRRGTADGAGTASGAQPNEGLWDRRPRGTPEESRQSARRRPANGGGQPRWQAGLFYEFALRRLGRAILSGRRGKLDGEAGCRRQWRDWFG